MATLEFGYQGKEIAITGKRPKITGKEQGHLNVPLLPISERAVAGLRIEYKDPGGLNPRARNPRTHSAKQVRQIAASIEQFGFMSPVLVDSKDGIIAGHGRVTAAKLLGMSDIPTVSKLVSRHDAGDLDLVYKWPFNIPITLGHAGRFVCSRPQGQF